MQPKPDVPTIAREALFRQVFEDVGRVLAALGTKEEWTSDTRERDDECCIELYTRYVHTCALIFVVHNVCMYRLTYDHVNVRVQRLIRPRNDE